MAVIGTQVLGKPKKSVGDIVFRRTNGQTIASAKPASYNDANTIVQQQVRQTMKEGVALYQMLKPLVDIGYNNRKPTHSKFNAFMRNMLNNTLPSMMTKAEIVSNIASRTAAEKTPIVPGTTPLPSAESMELTVSSGNASAEIVFASEIKHKVKYTGKRQKAMAILVNIETKQVSIATEDDAELIPSITVDMEGKSFQKKDFFAVALVYSEDCKIIGTSSTEFGWTPGT